MKMELEQRLQSGDINALALALSLYLNVDNLSVGEALKELEKLPQASLETRCHSPNRITKKAMEAEAYLKDLGDWLAAAEKASKPPKKDLPPSERKLVDHLKGRRISGPNALLKPDPLILESNKKKYEELKADGKIPQEAFGKWISVNETGVVSMDNSWDDVAFCSPRHSYLVFPSNESLPSPPKGELYVLHAREMMDIESRPTVDFWVLIRYDGHEYQRKLRALIDTGSGRSSVPFSILPAQLETAIKQGCPLEGLHGELGCGYVVTACGNSHWTRFASFLFHGILWFRLPVSSSSK